jgi:hypothetical protein
VPATVLAALPPRAGFRRSFAPLACSRREELDPGRWSRAIHPWSPRPRAACQLLQSKRNASTTRGSADPRTPRRSRLLRSYLLRAAGPLSERGQPRFHGSGAAGGKPHEGLFIAAIARGGSVIPTRSARTPPVATAASAGGWSRRRRRCPLLLRDIHRVAGLGHAFAKPRLLGPPHALFREEKRITLHPRCLPSTGPPPKGFALAPPALCCQSVGGSGEPAPFRSSRVLLP